MYHHNFFQFLVRSNFPTVVFALATTLAQIFGGSLGIYARVKFSSKIESSLYWRYHTKARDEWRGPSPPLSTATLLTQGIEDSFSAKKKAGVVFADLTVAYDTVWHRDFTCKLLRTLPVRLIVSFIRELVCNRSFTLTTGNGAHSRLRRLKSGVPQGSVLAPLLSNIYTHDLPVLVARKFVYADDLAIMHSAED